MPLDLFWEQSARSHVLRDRRCLSEVQLVPENPGFTCKLVLHMYFVVRDIVLVTPSLHPSRPRWTCLLQNVPRRDSWDTQLVSKYLKVILHHL